MDGFRPSGKAGKVLGDMEPPVQRESRLFANVKTDGVYTVTSEEQARLERLCADLLEQCPDPAKAYLFKGVHQGYLVRGLAGLPGGYSSLDASRPWILFWILHSLELMGFFRRKLPKGDAKRVYEFLDRCQSETGGFGGGPQQRSHLAPTYAAIMSVVILGDENGYKIINRQKMYDFLMSVKVKKGPLRGGFAVTIGGEVDTRGTYTSLAVASILNIITPELVEGVAEFIQRNQTYEGGIGAEPGNEAHGGYTYCGLAALRIIGRTDALDLNALLRWTTQRQMSLEGGFQGRTNKLVDSCYSWWVGGIFPLLQPLVLPHPLEDEKEGTESQSSEGVALFDTGKLQEYILLCCQMDNGGLRDKPGKRSDYYHTCYALSGLSMAQHQMHREQSGESKLKEAVGGSHNLLMKTDPTYNATPESVKKAIDFFKKFPLPEAKEQKQS